MRMKRVIAIMTVCAMMLSVTACGADKASDPVDTENVIEEETDEKTEIVPEVEAETEPDNSEEKSKAEIETAIGEFEYACQTSDVSAMLDCLDSGFAQSLKSGRLLLNWMSTSDNSDEVIMDTMLIAVLSISDISVDLSTMEIEIEEIRVLDNVATVNALMTMDSADEPYRDKITFRMSKDGDKWYINGF